MLLCYRNEGKTKKTSEQAKLHFKTLEVINSRREENSANDELTKWYTTTTTTTTTKVNICFILLHHLRFFSISHFALYLLCWCFLYCYFNLCQTNLSIFFLYWAASLHSSKLAQQIDEKNNPPHKHKHTHTHSCIFCCCYLSMNIWILHN